MWKALLEGGESSQFAWRQVLKGESAGLRRFLTSTSGTADFIPCGESVDCGWRIGQDQLVGRCPEGNCPPKEFDRSELAMVDVDWPVLLDEIGEALGITPSVDRIERLPVAVQLGWIAPAQSARFPVFFCATTAFYPAFPMIQRFAERAAGKPFVLVVASRDFLDTDSLGLLHSRRAGIVFLDEDVKIDGAGRMEARDVANRLVQFALTTAGVTVKPAIPKFPTPEGAQWKDFTIVEVDGLTIELRARVSQPGMTRQESRQYTYELLGLTKVVGGRQTPTVDGEFLKRAILHRRVVEKTLKKWDSARGYRTRIGALLEHITGLRSEDAFTTYESLGCYEANFQVECEPGEETPLPTVPLRLNQKGQIARNRADE